MSISTIATKDTYAGNSSLSTPYPITFKFLDSDHVTVYADSVDITNTCSFAGDGTTGTGDFTTAAYAPTTTITVVLDVPLDQPVVLQELGSLPAKTIEVEGFDRLNMQMRRVWRKLGDVITFSNDEGGTGSTGTADNLLGFDGSGDLAEIPNSTFRLSATEITEGDLNASTNTSLDLADTALQPANDLSDLNDAATARTNLGLGTASTTAATDYVLNSEVDQDIKTLNLPANTVIGTFGADLVSSATRGTAVSKLDIPISELGDTTMTNPASGEVISWNGSAWVNSTTDSLGNMLESVYDPTAVAGDAFDASNHVYTPAGTGAVATDVETKLREGVSVKDFGAVGDGTTDDTVAIQAALDHVDSLGGGSVYVPATSSFYKLTETLEISSFTKLYGDGHGSSLNWTVAPTGTIGYVGGSGLGRKGITNKDYLDGAGNYLSNTNISIEDLTLEQSFSASGLSNARQLVKFYNATNTSVKRCRILTDGGAVVNTRVSGYFVEDNEITIPTGFTYGSSSDGVIDQWDGSQNGFISGNSINGADSGGIARTKWSILLTGTGSGGGASPAGSVNDITITNNTITGCGYSGIELEARLDGTDNIIITNNRISGTGVEPSAGYGRGISIYGGTGVSVTNNHIYNIYRQGIILSTEVGYTSLENTHITVIGNMIEDCSSLNNPIELRDCTSRYVTLTENDVLHSVTTPVPYSYALTFAGTSSGNTFNSNFSGNRLQTGAIAKCNKMSALGFNSNLSNIDDSVGVNITTDAVAFTKDTTAAGDSLPVFWVDGSDFGGDATNRVQVSSGSKGTPASIKCFSSGTNPDTVSNLLLDGLGGGNVVTDCTIKPLFSDTYLCGTSGARWITGHFGTGGVFINGQRFYSAAGSPEGAFSANVGSVYTRTDGGAGTTLYVKESGTGNTGWAAK